ncbi:beta-ketoacyl synthase N-terminal-like domain-containing protein, partial [Bowmanella dokdonensis]|nr:beta-ketoacyl-ACP synthase II [Bowmanella dokdonensis]
GLDTTSTWNALLRGESGIGNIESFDVSNFSTRFAGAVKGFDVEQYMPKKESKKMDLFIQYGVAAGMQALKDSGLQISEANAGRVGVAVGSGIGGLGLIEENHSKLLASGPRKISPFFVPSTIT